MRNVWTIAALALAAALAAAPAGAQDSGDEAPGGYEQPAEQQNGAVIPPSAAVRLAMQAVPGSKALGVKLRGGFYVVRLKQDGTITQVGVDPATGEVFQLQ